MSELVPVAVVHAASGSLWITCHCFDVNLQTALQQLIHLTVIIIIISADAQYENTCSCFNPRQKRAGLQYSWLYCASTLGGAMGIHSVHYDLQSYTTICKQGTPRLPTTAAKNVQYTIKHTIVVVKNSFR